eukprot:scaffold47719_cov12-Tisochrysis_lutea.AAC.1
MAGGKVLQKKEAISQKRLSSRHMAGNKACILKRTPAHAGHKLSIQGKRSFRQVAYPSLNAVTLPAPAC